MSGRLEVAEDCLFFNLSFSLSSFWIKQNSKNGKFEKKIENVHFKPCDERFDTFNVGYNKNVEKNLNFHDLSKMLSVKCQTWVPLHLYYKDPKVKSNSCFPTLSYLSSLLHLPNHCDHHLTTASLYPFLVVKTNNFFYIYFIHSYLTRYLVIFVQHRILIHKLH